MSAQRIPTDLVRKGVTGLRVSHSTAGWIATGPGWLIATDELNQLRDRLRQRRRLPQQHPLVLALFARGPPD